MQSRLSQPHPSCSLSRWRPLNQARCSAAHSSSDRKNADVYSSISTEEPDAGPVSLMMSTTSSMSRRMTKPEVLAPAGGWPQLQAACENGADAVYFGLDLFSARARASNFTLEELGPVCAYLRERGVKGFVALNVLVFDNELDEVEKRIRAMAEAGVDAVIVQDLGVVLLMRMVAPNLPVHGSTQMSITSAEGASFAASLGVDRVVVGRELSIKEIESVRSKVRPNDVEVEAFVHGALCVSYSGQCFSSEAWGGRSANRGACAQACRMPYALIANGEVKEMGDERYLLSPQDLMAVELVPQLMAAGVSCFKIEGRLKGPEYVSTTTRAYRQAVDKAWEAFHDESLGGDIMSRREAADQAVKLSQRDRLDLEQVFSRGQDEMHRGLTPGYLLGTQHQMVVRGRNPRHRGQLLGRVSHVEEKAGLAPGEVVISAWISELLSPLSKGNGIVFDGGELEGEEAGGQVTDVSYWQGSKGKKTRVSLKLKEVVEPGEKEVCIKIAYRGETKVNVGNMIWKTKDADVEARMKASWNLPEREKRKSRVQVSVSGRLGEKLTIRLADEVDSCCASSLSELQLASKRCLSLADIEQAVGSLGDNALDVASIDSSDLHLDAGLFLPLSELKATRRTAVDLFMELKNKHGRDKGLAQDPILPKLLSSIAAVCVPLPHEPSDEVNLRLLCRTRSQVEAASKIPWLKEIIVDFLEVQGLKEAVSYAKGSGKKVVVATPRILKPDEERLWLFYLRLGPDALLIRSLGFLEKMIELGGAGASVPSAGDGIKVPELEGDFSLNASNGEFTASCAFLALLALLTP